MPWDIKGPVDWPHSTKLQVGDVVSVPTPVWPWWLGRTISGWLGLVRLEQRNFKITEVSKSFTAYQPLEGGF